MIVDVQDAQYYRLLGYPRDHVPSDRALELAAAARAWYADHGTPWTHTHRTESIATDGDTVALDGAEFQAPRLAQSIRGNQARAAAIVAASAGPELESESQRLWREGKPDEYFFLEVFGSAVVERLIAIARAAIPCALSHDSPGYRGFEIHQQPRLLNLIRHACPGPIEALDSGALRPRKSQLAVFPVASYQVSVKALQRWVRERLTLTPRPDASIDAVFRYDGVTCTNLGRELAFDYHVHLAPRDQAHRILAQRCVPAGAGHTFMCRHEEAMPAIATEAPLAGRPLAEILAWRPATAPAACYCEPAARLHKWHLVFETLHYALTTHE